MKNIKIIEHGVIYRNPSSPFCYNGWPTVARLSDDSLAVVWSGFRIAHVCPFGKTAMSISRDEGKYWGPPMVINDTPLDDRDAGILSTSVNNLLVSWFCHPKQWMLETVLLPAKGYLPAELYSLFDGYSGIYDKMTPEEGRGGPFVRLSENNGISWGDTIRVPVSSPHGPARLADGSLVYLGQDLFEGTGKIYAYSSEDKGKTWALLSTLEMPQIPENFKFYEPHAVQLLDGSLLGTLRYEGQGAFTVYTTRSTDLGKTWSIPSPLIPVGSDSPVCGSPPHLTVLSSGAVICSVGRRKKPFGQRALVSYDSGVNWEEFVIRDDAPNGDLGYPATVELKDKSLLTVYYQCYCNDKMPGILYTRWALV